MTGALNGQPASPRGPSYRVPLPQGPDHWWASISASWEPTCGDTAHRWLWRRNPGVRGAQVTPPPGAQLPAWAMGLGGHKGPTHSRIGRGLLGHKPGSVPLKEWGLLRWPSDNPGALLHIPRDLQ